MLRCGWFQLRLCAVLATLTACGSRGDSVVTGDPYPRVDPPIGLDGGTDPSATQSLPGVDTSSLSARELDQWWSYVATYLAPCPSVPVSIAVCIQEARPCSACVFAARFLASEARKGRSDATVSALYASRFAPEGVTALDLTDTPSRGAAAPSVSIVEFADYQCPYCKTADGPLRRIVQDHGDAVALYFKNYPLSYHAYAKSAALASVAAQNQGKFWEMHDAIYQTAPNLTVADIQGCAASIGLDSGRFTTDWSAQETAARVQRDINQGDAVRIAGTPTIFINGRVFPTAMFDLSADLASWIQMEIEMTRAVINPQ